MVVWPCWAAVGKVKGKQALCWIVLVGCGNVAAPLSHFCAGAFTVEKRDVECSVVVCCVVVCSVVLCSGILCVCVCLCVKVEKKP